MLVLPDRLRMLLQNVSNAITSQRLTVAVHEDMLVPGFCHAAQPLQSGGCLAPQWQQSLLLSFPTQPHLAWLSELQIIPSQICGFAHARTAVIKEQQERVVAPPVVATTVRLGDDRSHVIGLDIHCWSLAGPL